MRTGPGTAGSDRCLGKLPSVKGLSGRRVAVESRAGWVAPYSFTAFAKRILRRQPAGSNDELEPVAKVLVFHLCRKLRRSLSRKTPDPTNGCDKGRRQSFSSAYFCNSLGLGLGGGIGPGFDSFPWSFAQFSVIGQTGQGYP